MPNPTHQIMYQPPSQGGPAAAPKSALLLAPAAGGYATQVHVDNFGEVDVRAYAEGSGIGVDVYGRGLTASGCLGSVHVSSDGRATPAFRPGVDLSNVAEALRLASQKEACPQGFKTVLRIAATDLETRAGAGPSAGFAVRR